MSQPIEFQWDGDAMVTIARCRKLADQQFVVGQIYALEEVEERSWISHAHEFAWLKEAWRSLPEDIADNFPTPDYLRKRALIDAGYFDEEIIDAGSSAAALRVAASFRRRETFALVVVRGAFVIIRTAKSQARRAMDKAEFQASKQAVLETVAAMIGVAPATLAKQSEDA